MSEILGEASGVERVAAVARQRLERAQEPRSENGVALSHQRPVRLDEDLAMNVKEGIFKIVL